jgi:hypothetical protein
LVYAARRSLWRLNPQVATDLLGKEIVDLAMARQGGSGVLLGIMKNGVA